MVKVNGTELDIAGKTVSEYLATIDYDPKQIAVERNGDIVFKSHSTMLSFLKMATAWRSSVLWEAVD